MPPAAPPSLRRRRAEGRAEKLGLHRRRLAQQRDMRGDDAPALGRPHPGMALPAGLGRAVPLELAVRRAEVAAVGHDPELEQVAVLHELRIAARAEGRDLVVAVELLAD